MKKSKWEDSMMCKHNWRIEKTFGRYKGKSDIEDYISSLVSRLVAEQQSKATVETRKPTQDNKPTKPVPIKLKLHQLGLNRLTT